MPLLCLDCNEIYDNRLNNRLIKVGERGDFYAYLLCPKTSCGGRVVEIDELFLPTISILNIKGYKTKYCCSAHYYESKLQSYISFEKTQNYKIHQKDIVVLLMMIEFL